MTRKLLFTPILLVVVLGISGLALAQAASGTEENKAPAPPTAHSQPNRPPNRTATTWAPKCA